MSRIARPTVPALLTALIAATALPPAPARADEPPPEYQVEILIVEPVMARSDAWAADGLTAFDRAQDPALAGDFSRKLAALWAPLAERGLPLPDPFGPRLGVLPDEDDAVDEERIEAEPTVVERPPAWIALPSLPETLADARNRLERDGLFSIVTALAWLQPAGRPRERQPVRLRDAVVIQLEALPDEPVEGSLASTNAMDPSTPAGPITRPGPGPGNDAPIPRERPMIDASIQPVPPNADPSPPVLEPARRAATRLDGTVALVQRQFLHVELDLHWREAFDRPASFADEPARGETRSVDAMPDDAPSPGSLAPDGGWRVHRMDQSRVVRPDRWEYFDSERFGVLVRISELPPLLPVPEPPPEPEPDPIDPLPSVVSEPPPQGR